MSPGSPPPPGGPKARPEKAVSSTAADLLKVAGSPVIAEASAVEGEDRGDIHRRATVNMETVVAPGEVHRRATVDMEAVVSPKLGMPRSNTIEVQPEWLEAGAEGAAPGETEVEAQARQAAERRKARPPWQPPTLPPPPENVAKKRPVTAPIPREDDGSPAANDHKKR